MKTKKSMKSLKFFLTDLKISEILNLAFLQSFTTNQFGVFQMVKEKTYITIYNAPKEIHSKAKLWKPLLERSINDILIEMLEKGAQVMQKDALEKAQQKFGLNPFE
jgi:hypothetical protein